MSTVYIDADACPVKEEVYRVAERYGLQVIVVANSWIRTPRERLSPSSSCTSVLMPPTTGSPGRSGRGDIVVTADIPLADRVLKAGAQALHPTGRVFTPDGIGSALASRAIGEHLRSMGEKNRRAKAFRSG